MGAHYIVDYSGDYGYTDGVELIILVPQNPTSGPINDVSAVRSTVDLEEIQQFESIGTNGADVLFVVYLTTTSTIPSSGDLIFDAGVNKYIVSAVRVLADVGQARTFCTRVQN
ncbi:MAG: hypothetical protein HN975_02060 [Anaerolineae bacterium]|jgi:hypothetical protein|nr:hypothetical protein [Anaerolineae bacterium]